MDQDKRYDEVTYDPQSYDYTGYDLQGYDVPAYDDQAYAEAGDVQGAYAEEAPAAAAVEPPVVESRVPHAAPAKPREEARVQNHTEYDDDQEFVEDDEDDFPEPEEPKKGKKAKAEGGKRSPIVMVGAGVGAVAIVGAFLALDPLGLGTGSMLEPVTSMIGLSSGDNAEAPPPEAAPPADQQAEAPKQDGGDWQAPATANGDQAPAAAANGDAAPVPNRPHRRPRPAAAPNGDAAPAGDAAPVAQAPADNPEFQAKPKPRPHKPVDAAPVAAKPKKKPAAPVAAAPAPAASFKTALAFAPGSYWVAAAEVEKLWAFSSRIKQPSGQVTVEGWAGAEANGAELSAKRAERVAELLRKNNVGSQYTIKVKAMGRGEGPRVNVIYSSKL